MFVFLVLLSTGACCTLVCHILVVDIARTIILQEFHEAQQAVSRAIKSVLQKVNIIL